MDPKEFFQRLFDIANEFQGLTQDKEAMQFCIADLDELIGDVMDDELD